MASAISRGRLPINDTIVDSRPVDERSGRIVFGIAAVILDLVLATLVIKRRRGRSEMAVRPAFA